ncbi:lens fiber membrane intrinsic protein-like [Lissotriton helveticus]
MIALKVSGLLLTLTSTIALIVSIATNQWVVTPDVYFGVWVACTDSFCTSIPSVSVFLNVTRYFLVISLVLLMLAVSMQISAIKGHNLLGKLNMQKQAGSWSLIAGVFTVIAMSVFTATSGINPRTDYYAWSYKLGWVSAGVSLVAGIIGYYVFKKEIPALLAQPEPVTGQATQIMANPYTVEQGAVQQYPVQQGVVQLYPVPLVPNQPYPGSTEGFVPYHEPPPAYATLPDLALPYPQYPVQAAFSPQPE